MSTTFKVSDVKRGRERREPNATPEAVHAQTAIYRCEWVPDEHGDEEPALVQDPTVPCEAWSELSGGVSATKHHPFVAAVHAAFEDHYPLRFTPDEIWTLIVQGVARHIELNAEELRSFFVRHENELKIEVRRDDFVMGRPENPWPEVFGDFGAKIREHIGKRHDLLVSKFSTTGALELAVSNVAMMSALQSYFNYDFMTFCGIPEITLAGTKEDWSSIRTRAEFLRELKLGWWIDHLAPILDHFVRAAEGRPDLEFWRSIYKRNDESGGPYVTGWLQVLFPYLSVEEGTKMDRNPNLDWRRGMRETFGGGPNEDHFPSGLSAVPFNWSYRGKNYPMQLLGGFIGISHDASTLELEPRLGWAIRHAR